MTTVRNRPQVSHTTAWAVVLFVVLAFTGALTTHGSLKAQAQTAPYSVVDIGAFNPFAMNASGNVVGFDPAYRPMFWSAPVLTDLFPVLGTAILTGINNSGQIIGNDGSRYFIYSSNSVTDIGVSTWGYNNPGINNYGHVVGSNASGLPFLYRDGTAETLSLPGCDWATAEGVNDSDVIIGNGHGGNCGGTFGVVWVNGAPQILPTLPDASAGQLSSMGLNAGGQIVGEAFNPNPTAMLWQPDGHGGYTFTNLGTGNGYGSYAQGVNDLGVVVGEVDTAAGPYAYIWHSASGMQDLNTLVPSGTDTLGWAGKINNAGMIMAYSYSSGHAYLLTPIASMDSTAPTLSCAFADASWHATNVSLSCTAADTDSGLANTEDVSFTLSTHVAAGVEDVNAATDSRTICDNAGNCASAGPIPGNRIDRRAPAITIAAPAAGTFTLGQVVGSSYGCTDDGSGVATCNGQTVSGQPIDTASVGVHAFAVSASDLVGNTSSASVSYTVSYNVCPLFDTAMAHKAGSTLPVKLNLCTATGANASSSNVALVATGVYKVSSSAPGLLEDSGNADPDDRFRFAGGSYIFNLSLRGFGQGTYALEFTAGGDPSRHVVQFQVK